MSARTAGNTQKGYDMSTYTNPFAYGAEIATRDEIINDPAARYTIVTEIDEYLGQPIATGNLDDRYDIMITLDAADAVRAVETLTSADCDRAVMIVRGRVDNRRDLPTVVPAGYVYPLGQRWCRVIDPS